MEEEEEERICFPVMPMTSDAERLGLYITKVLPICKELKMQNGYYKTKIAALDVAKTSLELRNTAAEWKAKEQSEKCEFLERYAASLVKERNSLLHQSKFQGPKTTSTPSHFVWHSCCRRNAALKDSNLDTVPSILTLRGDKLKLSISEAQVLRYENQTLLLAKDQLEMQLEQQNTVRDGRRESLEYKIQLLETQLTQRISMQSALGRRYNSTEKALHDKQKDFELLERSTRDEIGQLKDTICLKEEEIQRLSGEKGAVLSNEQQLTQNVQELTTRQTKLVEELTRTKHSLLSAETEAEALRSQVEMLDNQDFMELQKRYTAEMEKQRMQWEAREQELTSMIESLRIRPVSMEEQPQVHRVSQDTIKTMSDLSPIPQQDTTDHDWERYFDENDESFVTQGSVDNQEVDDEDTLDVELKRLLEEAATRRHQAEAQAAQDMESLHR